MSIFGVEHILFLTMFLVLTIVSVILVKKFVPQNKIHIVVKIVAGLLLFFVLSSRISLTVKSQNLLKLISDSFCSIMGFVLSIVALFFRPTSKTFQYAISAGFTGGFLTIIYPDFINNYPNIFLPIPFTGLVYHALMAYMLVLVLCCKYYSPTFKNWSSLPIGLAFMVVFGLFGNQVLGQSNNMCLNAPLLPGTIFTWWVLGIFILIVYTITIQVFEMITLPKNEWSVVKLVAKIKTNIRHKKDKNAKIETDE